MEPIRDASTEATNSTAPPASEPPREFSFSTLLIALLAFIAVSAAADPRGRLAFLIPLAALGLILATTVTLVGRGRHFAVLLVFAALAVALRSAAFFVASPPVFVADALVTALFLGGYLVAVLRGVLADGAVTNERIMGALSGYLLLGIAWSFLFVAVEVATPGSFRYAGGPPEGPATPNAENFPAIYYSFITLTTIGYGDIVPLTRPAQTLAWLEGTAGQIYLAVLVARLVGLQITNAVTKQ
jgi:hypothetical protein